MAARAHLVAGWMVDGIKTYGDLRRLVAKAESHPAVGGFKVFVGCGGDSAEMGDSERLNEVAWAGLEIARAEADESVQGQRSGTPAPASRAQVDQALAALKGSSVISALKEVVPALSSSGEAKPVLLASGQLASAWLTGVGGAKLTFRREDREAVQVSWDSEPSAELTLIGDQFQLQAQYD